MKLTLLPMPFTVARTADTKDIPVDGAFVFTARTDTELSLVCPTGLVPSRTLARQDGWRAFRFEGTLDFSLVGVLAKVSSLLAQRGISIFAVSTYQTDYVLVRQERWEETLDALRAGGYELSPLSEE